MMTSKLEGRNLFTIHIFLFFKAGFLYKFRVDDAPDYWRTRSGGWATPHSPSPQNHLRSVHVPDQCLLKLEVC